MNSTEFKDKLTEWRHELHRKPEAAFEEENTAAFIAEKLSEMGIEVTTGIGGTGVVGTLTCGNGKDSIAIRSDMDSLKIDEKSDHDHVSEIPGRMHACGHDGHMATLLGAAELISTAKDFNGTVHFIFQPAEEPGKGAKAMIDDGLFERFSIDEIYGLHNAPFLPAGNVRTRVGGIAASEDDFTIKITGKGGHASSPHEGVDPLACFAEMYMGFQTIVSRNVTPSHPVVISCTEIETDGAHNAIPGQAIVRGDTRCYYPEDQKLVEERMRSIAEAVCDMNGAKCEFEYTHEFQPVVNDAGCVETIAKAAAGVVGEDKVEADGEPWTVSEDFALYLDHVPGAFILLGSGRFEGDISLHDNTFDYNDEVLVTGAEIWHELVRQRLK